MEKRRKTKILSIIALVIAIAGMSLGFAAFSVTLNISSSANVTPSSDSFKVVFSSSNTAQEENPISPVGTSGDAATISGTTISGLSANFTSSSATSTYVFYVHNVGAYTAYLNKISFGGKTCTPGEGASSDLVAAACDDIYLYINVNGTTAQSTDGDLVVYNHSLASGDYEFVIVNVTYGTDGALADGPFTVTFEDLTLDYSTVDSSVTLISFTISGTTYYAEEGMTWEEWIDSAYNTGGFYSSNQYVYNVSGSLSTSTSSSLISVSSTINANGSYVVNETSVPV